MLRQRTEAAFTDASAHWTPFPDENVYKHEEEGGTLIIPGHGRICDEYEVGECRDMIAIIRDRVQAMINLRGLGRAGQKYKVDCGFPLALWCRHKTLDHGHVCRGCVQLKIFFSSQRRGGAKRRARALTYLAQEPKYEN